MKIKILINGNSFFYGRLMASYWPLHLLDGMTKNGSEPIDNVQFSQMPRVFLDPTLSQGGEMTLPFFWHADYLDLISGDMDQVGALVIKTLNGLKHTSGDTSVNTRVSVSVFAWLENVQLEGPTHYNPSGLISQVPVTLLRDSDEDSRIASEIRPQSTAPFHVEDARNLQTVDRNIMRGVGQMLNTDAVDNTMTMSMTNSTSVSSDTRIMGLDGTDELDIAYIASKESYLTKFNWALTDTSEQLLFNIKVMPSLWAVATEGIYERVQLPACAGATLPFSYWNGTFKMRLQIVASAFHRGRLAVVYDPHGSVAVREDNSVYTQIVDIADCRDVTFAVGPNQDRAMLQLYTPGTGSPSALYSSTALAHTFVGNGTIAVYVLNDLTIPNIASSGTVNNDIQVNVFISMDKDLQVFAPSSEFSNYVIMPQSTGVDVSEDVVDEVEPSEPYSTTVFTLDQPSLVSAHRTDVYIGERITTFKQLLKRYYLTTAIRTAPVGSVLQATQYIHRIFPPFRGIVPGAVHLTDANTPYNYFGTTMLNFLSIAYQGWRGSVRYKMFPRCKSNANKGNGITTVSQAFGAFFSITQVIYNANNFSELAHDIVFGGSGSLSKAKGVGVVVQSVNPAIEYQVPWWEYNRFCPGKSVNWTNGAAFRDLPISGAVVTIDSTNIAVGIYDQYVAAGEDFTLGYFTGWPPIRYEPDPPSPLP